MALPMTYSRRKRLAEQAGQTLPFRAEPFGNKLITQLFQLISQMDGMFRYDNKLFPMLVGYVRQELGTLSLARANDEAQEFYQWFIAETPGDVGNGHDLRLDAVELACQLVIDQGEHLDRTERYSTVNNRSVAIQLVEDVNERMMEDGFGFQFKDGQIIEFTSEFVYKEVVVPALALLSNPIFANANNEFRDAFEEFKLCKYDDCIADCGNAFESVIKIIATKKQWSDVKDNDTAAKLIEALYRHDLIPSYMQEQIKGLRMMLQGTGTLRNKEGGHGAGNKLRDIDRHLAAYQLHQTAAAIVLLVEQADL